MSTRNEWVCRGCGASLGTVIQNLELDAWRSVELSVIGGELTARGIGPTDYGISEVVSYECTRCGRTAPKIDQLMRQANLPDIAPTQITIDEAVLNAELETREETRS